MRKLAYSAGCNERNNRLATDFFYASIIRKEQRSGKNMKRKNFSIPQAP